jgi:ABC-type Mn2+/Zn2+ transport system ATPase subunit
VKLTEPNNLATPRLVCKDLQIGRAGRPLLPALNFEVRPSDVWVLIGRNGSGKSTLLQTLLGGLKPLSGSFDVEPSSNLAFVPQRETHDLCVPSRAWDMVESGVDRDWGFWRWGGRAKSVAKALDDVAASELAAEPYGHLSEGQKQRILMARALASGPDVILLDEPTSAMDPLAEQNIFRVIDELRRERSLSVIIASHSLTVLPAIATHVVFLDREQQTVLAGERSEVLSEPRFRAVYGNVLNQAPSS